MLESTWFEACLEQFVDFSYDLTVHSHALTSLTQSLVRPAATWPEPKINSASKWSPVGID